MKCPITNLDCDDPVIQRKCSFYIRLRDFRGCAFELSDMALRELRPEIQAGARFLDKVFSEIKNMFFTG